MKRNMFNVLHRNIAILISLFILIFTPNVYSDNKTLSDSYIAALPSEITIPFNNDFFGDDEFLVTYKQEISTQIYTYLHTEFSKILEENNLNPDCYGGTSAICPVSYVYSTRSDSDGEQISYEMFKKYLDGEIDYFSFYYRIYDKDSTAQYQNVANIPFKVYLNNNTENYNSVKEVYNSIPNEYTWSIIQDYKSTYGADEEDWGLFNGEILLKRMGFQNSNDYSFEVMQKGIGRYLYQNNHNYQLDIERLYFVSVKYKGKYYFSKSVTLHIDNYIDIPNNITETDDIIQYIKNYYNPLVSKIEVDAVYEDGEYYLDVGNIRYLLNVDQNVGDFFNGGAGTNNDPYQIANSTQLSYITKDLNAHYILVNDIDLTYDTTNKNGLFYNDGKGWLPISHDPDNGIYNYSILYEGKEFNGTLDGNNHSIIGLNIDRQDTDFTGLFGYIGGNGVIKNLKIENANVKGNSIIGIVAAHNSGLIENVTTNGIVQVNEKNPNRNIYIGGIVGVNSGTIEKVYNFATVKSITNTNSYESKCAGISSLAGNSIMDHIKERNPIIFIKDTINFGNIICINEYKKDHPTYASQYAAASGIVVQNGEIIFNVANFGKIYGNNASGLVHYNNWGYLVDAFNAGKLELYKDFYTGTEPLNKFSTIYLSDLKMHSVYGLDLHDDDELSINYKGPFYKVSENDWDPWEQTIFEGKSINLDNTKTVLSSLDYNNRWQYYNNYNFPLIKGMPINIPNYTKVINDETIEIDEKTVADFSKLNYQLKYSFNNLDYDYIYFTSSSSKVIINNKGIINLNVGKNDEIIESTITIRAVLSNQSVSKKIVFKINRTKPEETNNENNSGNNNDNTNANTNNSTTNNDIVLKDEIIKNGYRIKDNMVFGFKVGDKISTIKSKFNKEIAINNNTDIISTGTEFIYKKEKYVVVIIGDLTGDGRINSADLLQMRKYLLGEVKLTGAYKLAGIIESANEIKSLDLLRLRQYLLGEYTFK